MRLIITILFIGMSLSFASAQQRTSVVSKVTATWCPNCGTWGWDYFEALKPIYENDTKATILGVHHSGDLRNPVSSWFANNLDFVYQPQFYHNNQDLDVSRNNWSGKVEELQNLVDQSSAENPSTTFNFVNAYAENGEIVCNVKFDGSNKSAGEFYFAIYVFENNVENIQSSRGMAMHPNVLRDVMMNDPQGELYTGADENGNTIFTKEYRMPLNSEWNKDKLGVLAIMWEEDGGSFNYDNASSIHNIGLLSSSSEIFEEDIVNVEYTRSGIRLYTDNAEAMKITLFDMNARLVYEGKLNGETIVPTNNLTPGLYVIHVNSGNKMYTQQVFVGR